ncbi:hypothetical protein [Rhizobium anhuiense]|uniref:hypothetical protein n=1 Tax=Rhizobium anhuiense TaxID=1184720 RepID=UPI0019CF0335|nr:hypothetical protein [Rhizobium anhuiense]GGD74989.1 hypothetical protein GCM10008012_18820 [Rhizobium anhuiense]
MIATDPHPGNERAIAVYKKLGFEPFGPPHPNDLLEPTRDIDLQIRPWDGIERRLTAQFRYRSV